MRINNPTHIDMKVLEGESPDRDLIVQFSQASAYNPAILEEVNDACDAFGARLQVRFYSHYFSIFDCCILLFLPAVRSLLLDCLTSIENLEYLRDLDNLESFAFDVFESRAPRFLEFENVRRLRCLLLGRNRRSDIDLNELAQFEHLSELTIVGHCKNIDVLAIKSNVETLRLRGISKTVPLGFVSAMAGLRRLSIGFGGRQTIDEIQHPGIDSLDLLRIRGLAKLNPVAFPALTNLDIEDQIQLERIDVSGTPRLKRLRIINCKGLVNLQGIETLKDLRELRLGRTGLDPSKLLSQKLPTQIKSLEIWGYGAKKDKQIEATLTSMGYKSSC